MSMAAKKILLSVFLASATGSVHADVTVNTTTTGKMIVDVSGTGVISIKGTRQRSDQTVGGKNQALIIDIDGRRLLNFDDM
jgi:hypothetical protein